MEQDQNLDASLTAFSAPATSAVDPVAAPSAANAGTSGETAAPAFEVPDDAYDDWEQPEVRESLVWGFRAFVAFAALVFFMFIGQLLSDDEPSTNNGPPPPTTAPAAGGNNGAVTDGGDGGGISDDGF